MWSPAMKIPCLIWVVVALAIGSRAANAGPAARQTVKPPSVSDGDPGNAPGSYYSPTVRDPAGNPVPVMQIPGSIVVIPQQVIQDQQAISVCDALRNVSGVSCR
jgi:outer membrane receptor for monomeric catechols